MKYNKRILSIVLTLVLCVSLVLSLAACKVAIPKLVVTFDSSHDVYEGDTLDSLRPYLTVVSISINGTVTQVDDYTLSGELSVGNCVIMVKHEALFRTITITVLANDDGAEDDGAEDDGNNNGDNSDDGSSPSPDVEVERLKISQLFS